MTIGYKLVSQDYTTYGGMKWEIGKTNVALEKGTRMCSPQVLHYYEHPLLAILFNPRHASIPNPRMLKIECSEKIAGDGLKAACKEQTPIEEMELPVLTTNQRVAFAIKCALSVCKENNFVEWANKWLSREDRTEVAAAEAYAAAAAHAVGAEAHAAAAYAAEAAEAHAAAAHAVGAAEAAVGAAHAAAHAAAYAAGYALNLASIIEEVLQEGY